MNKLTLAAIVAATGIATGGAVAVSRMDPSRFRNTQEYISPKSVDLGMKISRDQLLEAVLSAAYDVTGKEVHFKEVYDKGYKLGSVEETREYRWTEVEVSLGFMRGLELTIHKSGFGDNQKASLTVRPLGFVSDKEIKGYLNKLSANLQRRE